MFDPTRLLDQFLGAGQPDARQQQGSAQSSQPGGLESLSGALGGISGYAKQNPMLSGALAGGLAAILLGSKSGRKLATGALTYGGVAAIGGLAYKAYRDYQERQSGAPTPASGSTVGNNTPLLPPPSDSPFALVNAPQGQDQFALALVSAMIAAAKADGHIDDAERERILGRLSADGLDAEEQAFLARELSAPLDIERVVKSATTQAQAVEIYTASALAITPDHPAERGYLDMLAARLGLEPELARTIERTLANVSASPEPARA